MSIDVTDRMSQLAHLHHNIPNKDCSLCPPCCYSAIHTPQDGGCHCLVARDGTHYQCKCGPAGIREIVAEELEMLIQADPMRFCGPPGLIGESGTVGPPGKCECQCHEGDALNA